MRTKYRALPPNRTWQDIAPYYTCSVAAQGQYFVSKGGKSSYVLCPGVLFDLSSKQIATKHFIYKNIGRDLYPGNSCKLLDKLPITHCL